MQDFEAAVKRLKQMAVDSNIERREREAGGPLSAHEIMEITISTLRLIETVGKNND